jgi:starch phosphorylase
MKTKHTTGDLVKRLRGLAFNLWWSWNPAAQKLFSGLSPLTWETSNHNPVAVLAQFSDEELRARLGDSSIRTVLIDVLDAFDRYMTHKAGGRGGRMPKKGIVAYFCAEFGFHECLPMYSGGLGVLAGDHTKSASDLGLPFVGVGLFYRQGYFQQEIDAAGMQQESYPHTNPNLVPVELVRDAGGKPIVCNVEIGSNTVYFQAWKIRVGRSQVYLLDTDVLQNEEHLRGLTALAYGGDVTTRIRQEIVLGIGGVRFLRALGVKPAVFHMNEGHAAFLTLELLCECVKSGSSIPDAIKKVRKQCVFTTHTPVPAGHDKFPKDLFEFTLRPYAEALGISVEDLMEYGLPPGQEEKAHFTMTILALKLSRAANGVSKKHGEISRDMWKDLFAEKKPRKVPIGYITNGVHVPSWATSASWQFWERHNSHKWKEDLMEPKFWKHITDPKFLSDEELWSLRYQLRRGLVEFVRRKAKDLEAVGGAPGEESHQYLLSTDALTIGYARRFALYKRAPLFFRDMEKIEELFNDAKRPLQIVFAGKSHPHDTEGKEFLHQIVEMARHPRFFGKIIFLENYDMNVARHLVAGCDVWLNTPRKPLEASGTSGQKIAINGGLHFSILDGWWNEAYNGQNGWAIEGTGSAETPEDQDRLDAESLYKVLQKEIIPMFYQRDSHGIPRKWIARIRNAMRTIVPVYNTHRMVAQYAERYYFPKK